MFRYTKGQIYRPTVAKEIKKTCQEMWHMFVFHTNTTESRAYSS